MCVCVCVCVLIAKSSLWCRQHIVCLDGDQRYWEREREREKSDHLSNTIVQMDGRSMYLKISDEEEEDGTRDLAVFSTCISIMPLWWMNTYTYSHVSIKPSWHLDKWESEEREEREKEKRKDYEATVFQSSSPTRHSSCSTASLKSFVNVSFEISKTPDQNCMRHISLPSIIDVVLHSVDVSSSNKSICQ